MFINYTPRGTHEFLRDIRRDTMLAEPKSARDKRRGTMVEELYAAAEAMGFKVNHHSTIESDWGELFDVFKVSGNGDNIFVICEPNFIQWGWEVFLALPSEDFDSDLNSFYYKNSAEQSMDAAVIAELLN